METDDLLALGELADLARRVRGGSDEVYFVQNLYLNQTNVCRVKCKFCAFAKTQQAGGRVHARPPTSSSRTRSRSTRSRSSPRSTWSTARTRTSTSTTTSTILRSCKAALPDVHLKCYTASEIHHMTKLAGCSHEEVLRELKAAGLGSLPGGGAEVFAPACAQLVAPGKEPPRTGSTCTTPRTGMGMPTHCTMLYGHVETYEERIDHLLRLRELQDETGGFLAFIPLAFHPENTVFERRGFKFTTGADDLKMMAVSRLMLDNIPNIKAYWIMIGMPLAQVALHFGANDIQGTVVRETIFHAAGATSGTEQKVD